MVLAAVRDRMQATGVYVAVLNGEGLEVIARTGVVIQEPNNASQVASVLELAGTQPGGLVPWQQEYLMVLINEGDLEKKPVGLLGLSGIAVNLLDDDSIASLNVLGRRAALALRDRQLQQQVIHTLADLSPQVGLIQSMRAAGRYNETRIFQEDLPVPESDLGQWVKEALTHYWGGPKLTESPLIPLQVVQDAALGLEGNTANALRAVLREAIDRTRPEGDRKYTAEWILYNILEMKFMEGRKCGRLRCGWPFQKPIYIATGDGKYCAQGEMTLKLWVPCELLTI
jgi:hypothetical protein